jgi:MFS family permease
MDLETYQTSIKAGEIDYSYKWYVMAAVGTGVFLATIDGSIVNVALPTLERAYNTTFPIVQWVVLAYLLTVTTLMLSVGRVADMIGKKNIYASGFVIFTLGSVLCGLAPSVYWLVGFRVLQAVGAAMIMALGTAIITEAFPSSERGTALGISGSIVSLGIVIGPTLGGLLIQALSWHWIFFVNLPVGILGTWMALRYVPAVLPGARQRFDFIGALLLFISLLSLLLGLIFAGGLAVFIRTELRQDQPMIDLRLFQNRTFSTNLTTAVLVFVCIAGTFILMPFYLENVLGYDFRQIGLMLAVVPVMLGISAPLSGMISDRVGTPIISTLGLGILLVGYLAVSTLSTQTTTLGYLLRFVPIGLGIGIFQSPNNSAIMGTAPRERLGIASGILAVSRTLGQTAGIAILGAIWSSLALRYAGGWIPGGATQAAPAIQVAALQATLLVASGIIAVALVINLWALKNSREG